MGKRRYSPDEVQQKLREAERSIASGKSTTETCRQLKISRQTLYRWRAESRREEVPQAPRLRELADENRRLRRIVVDQALLIQKLREM